MYISYRSQILRIVGSKKVCTSMLTIYIFQVQATCGNIREQDTDSLTRLLLQRYSFSSSPFSLFSSIAVDSVVGLRVVGFESFINSSWPLKLTSLRTLS
uniref:Uncharacterized protein n=1 Tax=Rhizophora mucronata TaxID=61149 RepID=A0A2P2PV21_RHIMU